MRAKHRNKIPEDAGSPCHYKQFHHDEHWSTGHMGSCVGSPNSGVKYPDIRPGDRAHVAEYPWGDKVEQLQRVE